jgi:HlyD family secretion protein
MEKSIFRKISLDRLSSPEQLDQLMRVTGPKTWIGLGAIFVVLTVAVVWGYTGSIPTTANGQGVVLRRGGVLNVVTRGGGLVLSLDVKVGDKIAANQVVAKVAQPVLAEKINAMRQALGEAEQQRQRSFRTRTNAAKLQLEALQRQRANAERQIQEQEEQARLTTQQAAADDQLVAKGLITRQQALATRQKLVAIQDQIANLKAQEKQIDAQRFSVESQPLEEDADMQIRISSLRRDLAGAEQELSLAENVVTPYGGEVLELKVSPGGERQHGCANPQHSARCPEP